MSNPTDKPPAAHEPSVQTQQPSIPEWDQNAVSSTAKNEAGAATAQTSTARPSLKDRFNGIAPPDRTYFGLRRRWFLLILLCIFLAIVGLVIGLAVGLTRHGHGAKNLPLPSDRQQFTGDLTYYEPGLGACGIDSSDSDDIVAVSHIVFDAASTGANPNSNPLCGLVIRARRYDEQVGQDRSVDLKVVDRCVGCASTDIDVSPGAFDKMAAASSGRVDVTWAWLSSTPTSI